MRTSEERIEELHHRIDALQRAKALRRYRLICVVAYAGCIAVTVVLALGISQIPVQTNQADPSSTAGSIFTGKEPGYITVALLSLCLGVLATLFCFRMKRYMKGREKRNDR